MIGTTALARPYALAAYEQAGAEGAIASWSASLELIAALVSDHAMADVIANPRVDHDALTRLLLDICAGRLSRTQENFVRVLVDGDRLTLAPAISTLFEKERERSEGRASVTVVSAFEMDEGQRERVSRAMAKRLGRDVDLEVSVDKALIGGIVVRSGDVVIDASLRGRLRQLRAEFL